MSGRDDKKGGRRGARPGELGAAAQTKGPNGASPRGEKVGQEIHVAIADILTRGLLRDPRIAYITLTGVKMSPDLRVARVFYSMIGNDEQRAETKKGLEAAKAFVRREVTSRVKLRVSPEIFFTFDGSLEEGDKIERLLKQVKAKEGW